MPGQGSSARPKPAIHPFDQIRLGQEVLESYGLTLSALAQRIDSSFHQAALSVFECQGAVFTTGIGKAGLIAQKITATLASTGTPSHYLHPADAVHGDLGRLAARDLVLAFSKSGETSEITQLLPALKSLQVPLMAVTCRATSSLARASSVVLDLGPLEEACPLGLAPSTSTLAMLAIGDALALTVSRMKDFQTADFHRFHPGGSLGRKLSSVDDLMRPLATCRVAHENCTVRDVFVQQSRPGRRSGAIMLVDDVGRLTGLFTDSDLARLFESKHEDRLDGPIKDVMTQAPSCISRGARAAEAVHLLADRRFSELPVIDAHGRPFGMIDVTDIVALLPEEAERQSPSKQARDAA